MSARPEKILALQFKYFGDAVLLTPALRALREYFREGELHLLVPEEIAPLFQHLEYLDRVWPMPRKRGRAGLTLTGPVIRALRRERFDRSADFAGNDRGAVLSLLVGARKRLGVLGQRGFLGRRFCYHQCIPPAPLNQHESVRLANVLNAWNVPKPASLKPEIRPDPALAEPAARLLPAESVVFHIAAGQPKKEWPLSHWTALYQMSAAKGHRIVFTTGTGSREKVSMAELKEHLPEAAVVPSIPELPLFLAVLARARVFISGDTGPLHFAAGLGVPTISLFGPTSEAQWAPVGPDHRVLRGSACACEGKLDVCQSTRTCLAAISPEQVFNSLQIVLAESQHP